jgi:hypothetical protein
MKYYNNIVEFIQDIDGLCIPMIDKFDDKEVYFNRYEFYYKTKYYRIDKLPMAHIIRIDNTMTFGKKNWKDVEEYLLSEVPLLFRKAKIKNLLR